MKNLLILSLFLLVSKSWACQFTMDFCETLAYVGTLVETEISGIDGTTVHYSVKKVLLNEEAHIIEEIKWKICGDQTCNPIGEKAEIGQKFLLILDLKNNEARKSFIMENIGFCQTRALKIVADQVTISSPDGNRDIAYVKFLKDLHKICAIGSLDKKYLQLITNINAGDFLVRNDLKYALSYTIFDAVGRNLSSYKVGAESERIHYIQYLPSGLYFIRFSDGRRFTTRKFVKV